MVRDVRGTVARLRATAGGEVQVHGSPGLAQTLLAEELADELRLLQFPIVLGRGKRLFGDGAVPTALRLGSTQATGSRVIISTYRPPGRPALGSAPEPGQAGWPSPAGVLHRRNDRRPPDIWSGPPGAPLGPPPPDPGGALVDLEPPPGAVMPSQTVS